MKTPFASIIRGTLCVLFTSCVFSVAQAEEGNEPKKVPPGVLKKFDANQDGKLDDSEMAAWNEAKAKEKAAKEAKRLEKFDANKDGKLDESELAAEKAAKAEAAAKKKAEMEKKKAEQAGAQ